MLPVERQAIAERAKTQDHALGITGRARSEEDERRLLRRCRRTWWRCGSRAGMGKPQDGHIGADLQFGGACQNCGGPDEIDEPRRFAWRQRRVEADRTAAALPHRKQVGEEMGRAGMRDDDRCARRKVGCRQNCRAVVHLRGQIWRGPAQAEPKILDAAVFARLEEHGFSRHSGARDLTTSLPRQPASHNSGTGTVDLRI